MLTTLRERLSRFRNFRPRECSDVEFIEPNGRLYEFLEGVLLRAGGADLGRMSREMTVYDFRKISDWEDESVEGRATLGDREISEDEEPEETTESEAGKGICTIKRTEFEIAELAVDPGADLLVLVEVR